VGSQVSVRFGRRLLARGVTAPVLKRRNGAGLTLAVGFCRLAPRPLQAGGRWFEPGTAHLSTKPFAQRERPLAGPRFVAGSDLGQVGSPNTGSRRLSTRSRPADELSKSDADRWRTYYDRCNGRRLNAHDLRRDRNWFWRESQAGEDVTGFTRKRERSGSSQPERQTRLHSGSRFSFLP
jgi:hypothetical protein